jgi:hypothetical protein
VRGHYRFPVSVFCFCDPPFRELNGSRILAVTGGPCNLHCLIEALDPSPIMSRWVRAAVAAVRERQKESIGLSEVGVSATTAIRDSDEAERLCFTHCRRNGVMMDAVFNEVLERDRQTAVVITAVPSKFDFDSIHHPPTRKGKYFPRGTFQHLDQTRGKLAADLIAPFHDKSASLALVRFTMSDRFPSGRRSRYMPRHWASGTTRLGRAFGHLSVTKIDLVASWHAEVLVTLTNAPGPFVGALGAPLDALFRQASPQNRADRRCGLNLPPH